MTIQDQEGEVAALRREVDSLKRAVRPLLVERAQRRRQSEVEQAGAGMAAVNPAAGALEGRARELGVSGLLTRYGYYGSAKRSSTWSKDEQTAEELLGQDPVQVARVLAALGHPQRLQLLKAILERPASAAELVEQLGLRTTGQAYHHLHVLHAADLIYQEERGRFAFRPHRVQAFLTLLAGVSDALDPRYSAGRWEEPAGDAAGRAASDVASATIPDDTGGHRARARTNRRAQ